MTELTPIAEVFADAFPFSQLYGGYAVLEDDREINFTYDSYKAGFNQIDDERYTEQIKEEIERQLDNQRDRVANKGYSAYDNERIERMEALKLKRNYF